jgi:amino acid adenylation domain-containing protein
MTDMPTMFGWFARSARRSPTNLALRAAGVDLTYEELAGACAGLADDVVSRPGPLPGRVGLLVSRTAGTYVAYLAALRLGITVVPLNTEFPVARLGQIVRSAGIGLILHTPVDAGTATAVAGQTGVPAMETPDRYPAREADAGPADGHGPGLDDFAYIVFTSGSTGAPKGVPIRHRNIGHWLPHVLEFFEAGPAVRVSQTSDLAWDLSVWNVWLPWASGGALIVPARTDLVAPARHINADGITHWFSTPSSITMAGWLGDLSPAAMPGLRWSLFGGEPLTLDKARAWQRAAPGSVIANVYGPTEITVTCLTYRAPADPAAWPGGAFGALPLGGEYPQVEYAVADENARPAAEGELLLRGRQRFDGYLDPADNQGRFAVMRGGRFRPADGEPLTGEHWYRTGDRVRVDDGVYSFLGRLDNQVKVNGYRVEPGEIEAVMRRHPAVDEAVVVPWTAEDGTVELAGFVVSGHDCRDELRATLTGQFPAYMVPRFLSRLGRFPLNVNGKIDRRALTEQAAVLTDA